MSHRSAPIVGCNCEVCRVCRRNAERPIRPDLDSQGRPQRTWLALLKKNGVQVTW